MSCFFCRPNRTKRLLAQLNNASTSNEFLELFPKYAEQVIKEAEKQHSKEIGKTLVTQFKEQFSDIDSLTSKLASFLGQYKKIPCRTCKAVAQKFAKHNILGLIDSKFPKPDPLPIMLIN